jgi:hypothetical protein
MIWTKYFKTTNLTPPRLLVRGKGIVDFSKKEIDLKVLFQIWESGLPYLELTDEGKNKFLGIKLPSSTLEKKVLKKKPKEKTVEKIEEIINQETPQ